MAAILVAPLLVQIDEHIEAAIDLQLRMDVEVGGNLENPAGLDLMQAAASEVGIGNEPLDAGERFEPQQHLEGVHLVEKLANGLRDRAGLVKVAELLFCR